MQQGIQRAITIGAFGLAVLAAGCSKPEPPSIQPRAIRVASVTPVYLGLAVDLEVHNPNSFPLMIRTARGKLSVGNGVEVGEGQATLGGNVPANASSVVTADLRVNWTNLPALAPVALSASNVPYTFRGIASVGGERLNADIPFTASGEFSREQVIQVGLSGLSTIPGAQGRY